MPAKSIVSRFGLGGRRLFRFRHDKHGGVAMTFALSAVVLSGFVAVAVEYSRAVNLREHATVAADRAALAAVTAIDARRGKNWSGDAPDADEILKITFEGAMSELAAAKNFTFEAVYDVEETKGVTNVKVCFELALTTLLSLTPVGSSIAIKNCVGAQSSAPMFVDIHIFIDASGSMGIGASWSDIQTMDNTVGCMFACHTINWKSVDQPSLCSEKGWWSQTPYCATVNGAMTRFDVAKEALVSIFEAAKDLPPEAGQFAFSVHKFSNYTTRVHKLSTDYESMINAVRALEMDVAGAGTNVRKAMSDAAKLLPSKMGDGSEAKLALQHVFLITDGLENNVWEIKNGAPPTYQGAWKMDNDLELTTPGFWYHSGTMRNQVLNDASCEPVKARGGRISTLFLEYVTVSWWGGQLGMIRDQLVPHIPGRMQLCASSDRFAYVANDPAEIQRAINSMFNNVVLNPRLTQ